MDPNQPEQPAQTNPPVPPPPPTETLPQAPLPEVSPPESPSKLPPKKWLFVLLGALVLVLILTAAGYFLLTSRQAARQSDGERSFGSVEPPNQYTSTNCGYSVTYPEGWSVVADAEKEVGGALLISSSPVQSEIAQETELRVLLTCSDYDPLLDEQAVIKTLNGRYGSEAKVGLLEQTTVSAKPAYKQTVDVVGKNQILEYYIFSSPGRVIIVNFIPADTLLQLQIEEVLSSLVLS